MSKALFKTQQTSVFFECALNLFDGELGHVACRAKVEIIKTLRRVSSRETYHKGGRACVWLVVGLCQQRVRV